MKRNYGILVMFCDLCVSYLSVTQFEKIHLLSLYDTYCGARFCIYIILELKSLKIILSGEGK